MSRKQQLSQLRCEISQRGYKKNPFAGRNLKLRIEYDGTDYAGWQVQKNRRKTIQGTLETALRKILQEKVRIIASGRTDAGVHAQGQVANFKTKSAISLDRLQRALNAVLPDDIKISKIEEKSLDFNSCLNAKTKVYSYSILNRRYSAPLLRRRVYFYYYPLDIGLMRREARSLLGRHDFSAFCASGSGAKDRVRRVKRISIKKNSSQLSLPVRQAGALSSQSKDSNLITIDIEADGFLYNMVRNIVGTLLEIGRGKFAQGSLKRILRSKDRKMAGPTAPACALCLTKVNY
ncbi:MAG: tRNA pseudouridine(38-40) synthase TruA [Candidatus Omnitrophica bacterium]|nr:tRNA pseudouridine(38-40) synthase TruA [Candidatus Omnitrophota bacterium]